MDTKKYMMLKTQQGSRDGNTVEVFNKGVTYDLAPDLAEQFYHLGAIEEVTDPRPRTLADGEPPAGSAAKKVNPADARETKVTRPSETKDGEAGVDLATQTIEELVALARDHYGLDVDSTMSVEVVKGLIEQAQAEESHADISTMTKKQLVAFAKDSLGLDLDETSKKDEMLEAIKAHTAA